MVSFSLFSNTHYGANKKARLNSLKGQVAEVLKNNLLPELTDHSVTHSNNLTELVEKLAAPLTKPLNDDEAFLLYAACYLHDIGQQYEQANTTQAVANLGLSPSWEAMSREQRGAILRQRHNLISAEMVIASVQSAYPPIGFQLDNEDYPHLIAALCEAHILYMDGKDVERYQSLMQCSVADVRMALLSGLLRVADILDESQKRAKRVTALTRILPLLSQAHWYRHYYTQSVGVDVSSGKITLNFLFPQNKRDRYSAIILKLSLPEIKEEIFRHREAFATYGLNWYVVDNVDKNPYGNAEEMPEDVELEMLRLVQEREKCQLQTALQSNLNDYEAAQPIIEEMIRKAGVLPPDTAPVAKAKAWEEVADNCQRINAKHTEENALSLAFDNYGLANEIQKQLAVGLRLIRIQYDNENFRWVQQTIKECNEICAQSHSTQEEQFQLEIWSARLSGANFYSTTKDAYNTAITTAVLLKRSIDRICLAVELGEFLLLDGEIDQAISAVESAQMSASISCSAESGEVVRLRVRGSLVHAHGLARSNRFDEAILSLDSVIENLKQDLAYSESLALTLNTKAWLFHLNGEHGKAADILEIALNSIKLGSNPALKLNLTLNSNISRLLDNQESAYQEHSWQRDTTAIVGKDNTEEKHLIYALLDQKRGDHSSAFAVFWREVQAAYISGGWQRYAQASGLFAEECVFAQQSQLAIKFALEGEDEKLIVKFGNELLKLKNAQSVQAAVKQAVNSNLKVHIIIAEKLIEAVADAIPDELIQQVFQFLVLHVTSDFVFTSNSDSIRPAWRGLQGIASRLDVGDIQSLLEHTKKYSLVETNEFVVAEILPTLNSMVPNMSKEQLAKGAGIVFPLIDGTRPELAHKHCYIDAINFACHIAYYADAALKAQICDRIFPPDGVGMNLIQLQIMPKFRHQVLKQVEELAHHAMEQLRRQVSVETPEAKAAPSSDGATMINTLLLPDGGRLVTRLGCDQQMHAVSNYLEQVSDETRKLLLTECLSLAVDERNWLGNRLDLLKMVPNFVEYLNKQDKESIIVKLWPLAEGKGVNLIEVDQYYKAQDPLNPFKINMGNPVLLRGTTLYCLAKIINSDNSINAEPLTQIIAENLAAPDSNIRIGAVVASRELPQWSDEILIALLCGIGDPASELAAWCYHTLAGTQTLNLDQFRAGLMLNSMQTAHTSSNLEVRAGAGRLIQKIIPLIASYPELLNQAKIIADRLQNDFSYSVRKVFPKL